MTIQRHEIALVCQLHARRDMVPRLCLVLMGLLLIAPPLFAAEDLIELPMSSRCELRIERVRDERPACWHLRCKSTPDRLLGCDLSAMHLISQVLLAPNRAHLAVLSVGEGHPILEIIALRPLLKFGTYKSLCSLNPYPGTISIHRWQSGRLSITSDVDLTLANAGQRAERLGDFRYRVSAQDCQLDALD